MFENDNPGGSAAPGAKKPPPPATSPGAAPGNPWTGGTAGDPGTPPSTKTTTPDFPGIGGVLGGDANYQQLLSFDTAASGEDLATMNANIARMQGYYGSDSDPLSILGRVYQAYQDRNRYIANTLAGHGMIQSGETGWQGSRATLDYQRQELDARMKMEEYVQGLQQAFAQAERARKFNEMQMSWQALQNWLNGNPPTSVTDPGTPGSPGSPPTGPSPPVGAPPPAANPWTGGNPPFFTPPPSNPWNGGKNPFGGF